jgi:type VI protein secretion system component VasK
MAEIQIQRKSPGTVWWVLGIVALIVVVWMMWAWADTNQRYDGTSRFERGPAPQYAVTPIAERACA